MSISGYAKTFILTVLLVMVLAGCGSAPAAKKASQKEERPEWVDNYPVDPDYYIGIGSSNTGNKSEDLESAKARAITALATAISVSLQSRQDFTVREDSEGKSFQSAEIQITQSVNRNFREIEVYDSFSSEQSGYWFYYRISRARWAQIEMEEKREIISRVKGIAEPLLLNEESTDFELLAALGKGWQIVAESPYQTTIGTNLAGEEGVLLDLLESNISKVFSRLSIDVKPEEISTEPGKLFPVTVQVKDSQGKTPGQFRVDFYVKEGNVKAAEMTTEKDGTFSGRISFTSLPVGKSRLYASLSMPYLGINPELFRKKVQAPEKELSVTMNQVSVVLKLVISGDAEIASLPDSVKALFSRKELALRLTPEEDPEKHAIVFTVYFRNLPENTHGLFITNAKASISLMKQGSTIFSYETKEYREVGLSWAQAQERASIKLFRDINSDEVFIKDLHRSVYAGLSVE